MFEVASRNKLFLRLKDVYYAPRIKEKDPGFDAVYYFFCHQPFEPSQKKHTAVVDLTRDEEEILRSFRKRYREVISKMQKDQNLVLSVIEKPSKKDLDTFMNEYQKFAKEKGFPADVQNRLDTLHAHNRVILLNARYQNELVLQKVLLKDSEKLIFLHGYTTRLQEDDQEKIKIISAVNKTVEYHCMVYAKEKGLNHYDLGGLFEDPDNPDGIMVDHYKDGYRGEHVIEYEFIYPLTWKGQFFCRFKRMQLLLAKKKEKLGTSELGTS